MLIKPPVQAQVVSFLFFAPPETPTYGVTIPALDPRRRGGHAARGRNPHRTTDTIVFLNLELFCWIIAEYLPGHLSASVAALCIL